MLVTKQNRMEQNKKKGKELKKKGLKILAPKQLFQRLPIALAQVKAGNNSQSLLNEIRQIFCISQTRSQKSMQ